MTLLGRFVLAVSLGAKGAAAVVGLVPVCFLETHVDSACLWKRPSWCVIDFRRVGASFWEVTARSHAVGSGVFDLQCIASSLAERVLLRSLVRWFLRWVVLRARLVVVGT